MQANKPRDTVPELTLRSALHIAGLRYRKDVLPEPSLKCKADIVFPREKICVFVDGCFWHGCPTHFRTPGINAEWWAEKIADNKRRDREKRRGLKVMGWKVIAIWEHEITETRLPELVTRIAAAVAQRRRGGLQGN